MGPSRVTVAPEPLGAGPMLPEMPSGFVNEVAGGGADSCFAERPWQPTIAIDIIATIAQAKPLQREPKSSTGEPFTPHVFKAANKVFALVDSSEIKLNFSGGGEAKPCHQRPCMVRLFWTYAMVLLDMDGRYVGCRVCLIDRGEAADFSANSAFPPHCESPQTAGCQP